MPLCMEGRTHIPASSGKPQSLPEHLPYRVLGTLMTPVPVITAQPYTPRFSSHLCPILWLQGNHSFNICILYSSKCERNKEILQESLSPAVFNSDS